MNDEVKSDFSELQETAERTEAVIIGDLGPAFGYDVLNHAFRQVMDGAELIALQKNRSWPRADGLSLDVGPFVAAMEFASGREAYVVGKPARGFFDPTLAGAVGAIPTPPQGSGTTSSQTSAAPSAPASSRSSYGPASIAAIRCASPESGPRSRSTRPPTYPRRLAAERACVLGKDGAGPSEVSPGVRRESWRVARRSRGRGRYGARVEERLIDMIAVDSGHSSSVLRSF